MSEESKFQDVLDILSSGDLTQTDVENIFLAAQDTLYSDDEWRTERPNTIAVDGVEFNMKFKGKAQMDVIARLSAFIAADLSGVLEGLSKGTDKRDIVENIRMLAQIVDPDVFVGLGKVLTGMETEFVVENFDLEWILGGAEMAYNSNKVVKRMVTAFFGRLG